MRKFNLILNKIFEKYNFQSIKDLSIYNNVKTTFLDNICLINIYPKTENTNATVSVNINDTINCFITPLSISNFNLSKGDVLQTPDNSLFVIESNINNNLFVIRLIKTTGSNYTIKNNDIYFINNYKIFNILSKYNNIKELLKNSRNNFITFLNEKNLQKFVENNIDVTTDNTSVTLNITMTNDELCKILNKFYININIFDYNSFKYVYRNDIKFDVDNINTLYDSKKYIFGILKFETLKLPPDVSHKLIENNNYSYTTQVINNKTKFEKNYDNDKLLITFQLTLKDKSNLLDRFDNIESDYIYIII